MDKPSQIYNCDESGMPLEPKTVAQKGIKFDSDLLETKLKFPFSLVEVQRAKPW